MSATTFDLLINWIWPRPGESSGFSSEETGLTPPVYIETFNCIYVISRRRLKLPDAAPSPSELSATDSSVPLAPTPPTALLPCMAASGLPTNLYSASGTRTNAGDADGTPFSPASSYLDR